MWWLSILAVIAGALISIQASMNARLGQLLKNPILATSVAFIVAFFFASLFMIAYNKETPALMEVKSIPKYLWFGGVLSAVAVGSYYFLIPKMGIGSMMSYALTGQLLVAVVAGHFGWFDQEVKPVTMQMFAGLLSMTLGIFLINWEFK